MFILYYSSDKLKTKLYHYIEVTLTEEGLLEKKKIKENKMIKHILIIYRREVSFNSFKLCHLKPITPLRWMCRVLQSFFSFLSVFPSFDLLCLNRCRYSFNHRTG